MATNKGPLLKPSQKKKGAATETVRPAASSKPAPAKKPVPTAAAAGKPTLVPPAANKPATKARTAGKGKIEAASTYVAGTDADTDLLLTYTPVAFERMDSPEMVALFKRLKATPKDQAIANTDLDTADKNLARHLYKYGVVGREMRANVAHYFQLPTEPKPMPRGYKLIPTGRAAREQSVAA